MEWQLATTFIKIYWQHVKNIEFSGLDFAPSLVLSSVSRVFLQMNVSLIVIHSMRCSRFRAFCYCCNNAVTVSIIKAKSISTATKIKYSHPHRAIEYGCFWWRKKAITIKCDCNYKSNIKLSILLKFPFHPQCFLQRNQNSLHYL